jgi:hypothetical protein
MILFEIFFEFIVSWSGTLLSNLEDDDELLEKGFGMEGEFGDLIECICLFIF